MGSPRFDAAHASRHIGIALEGMPMGASQRRKGAVGELAFAKAIGGVKVPLSGAVEGYEGDVVAMGLKWQVKVRGNGFKSLYEWLKGHDALGLRADRHGWLVVMPVETLWKLLDKEEAR